MSSSSLKSIAIEFLKLVASSGVDDAYQRLISPNFRHHNPYFKGTAEALKSAMKQNYEKFPNKSLEIISSIEEGNQVAVFSKVELSPEIPAMALVHIFRFEDNLIAELWDIGQAVPMDCVNENGMFL